MPLQILMIGLISIPLIIICYISLLTSAILIRLFFNQGENAILHLSLLFVFVGLLFLSLGISLIFPEYDNFFFSLSNVLFWLSSLEIVNAHLALFLNKASILERYSPAILGMAVGLSLLDLYHYGLNKYPFAIDGLMYSAGIISLGIIIFLSINRLNHSLEWLDDENLELADLALRICQIGGITLAYTFFSIIFWISNRNLTEFEFLIENFLLLDWLVFFNIPIYLVVFLLSYISIRKIDFDKVNLSEILNSLDSPQEMS